MHYYSVQSFCDVTVIQVNFMQPLTVTYCYSVDLHNSIQMTNDVLLEML